MSLQIIYTVYASDELEQSTVSVPSVLLNNKDANPEFMLKVDDGVTRICVGRTGDVPRWANG